jgi:NAD(P)H dehydrogenase (quinone)
MRALVIACHPCAESFGAALRDQTCKTLKDAGHDVRLRDLYAEGFDPVMGAQERRGYHTHGENERPVADHLADLRWCEALIFVYPTWWYGPPAMLKGWLDRVWIPHATFEMPQPGKPIGPVLTNIRHIGAITTLGSPWWWWTFGVRAPGRLLTGLSVLCARGCRTFWLAHHQMDSSTAETRTKFLEKISARLQKL